MYGISFIVHLKSSGREVSINGAEVKGRVNVSYDEFSLAYIKDGDNIWKYEKEYQDNKPYYQILWNGRLDENSGSIRLASYEDLFLRFTFLDLDLFTSFTYRVGPLDQYIGFGSGTKNPNRILHHPNWRDVFNADSSQRRPSSLRNELKTGRLEFFLRAGGRNIPVDPSKINEMKVVGYQNWNRMAPERIFIDSEIF